MVALCALLALLTLAYCAKGLYYLVVKADMPNDMHLRWVETQYILHGENPGDIFMASQYSAAVRIPMWSKRPTTEIPWIGPVFTAGYPPWAYFANVPFYWPPWQRAARVYFAGWNVLALLVVFAYGYHVGRPLGALAGAILGFSGTAVSANATTLGVGQYGIVIVALIVATLWLLERFRDSGTAGVCLGLAFTKPILSGPFGVPLLFPIKPRSLIAVIVYMLVANGVIWAVTKANPVELVSQMLHAGQGYMDASYGPMNLLVSMGMPKPMSEAVTAVGCVGIEAVLLFVWMRAPLLVHFAIASVTARLWSYHHLYDNLVVMFLLIALGRLALERTTPIHVLAFLVMGLSLWAPGKFCDHLWYQIFQMVVWITGLALLLARTPRNAKLGEGVKAVPAHASSRAHQTSDNHS
jgi:hypothetical protein